MDLTDHVGNIVDDPIHETCYSFKKHNTDSAVGGGNHMTQLANPK